jgi:hypothetical protein
MFDTVSTFDLHAMSERAYREAARSWADYRREPKDSPVKDMLLASAESADAFYHDVRKAVTARRRDLDAPYTMVSPSA